MLLYACIDIILVMSLGYRFLNHIDNRPKNGYNNKEAPLGLKVIVLITVVSVYMVLLSTFIDFTR